MSNNNISGSFTDNNGGSSSFFISSDNSSIIGVYVEDEDIKKARNQSFNGGSSSDSQTKKKRNLPGTPDPNAEVIALSPETLMATNRFICEVCNKGFQRDQNLQLHRRGHNLPWKLKQRTTSNNNGGDGEIIIKKKVYICPEPSCVHHNRGRALGDLTGIKKHFSRKHGEKKWKCDKCSKKYAVHSDLKAHSKTCGSKEYKCDCGTLFSRRDSFITHRAFCDALSEESNRLRHQSSLPNSISNISSSSSSSSSPFQSQFPQFISQAQPIPSLNNINNPDPSPQFSNPQLKTVPHDLMPIPPTPITTSSGLIFQINANQFSSSSSSSGLMSATALLQKAAQMGASVSSHSGLPLGKFLIPTTMSSSQSQLPYNNVENGMVMNMEMMVENSIILNGIFDQTKLDAARRKPETKNGGGDRNTMTLDLLGAEGTSRSKNSFQEQAQQKVDEMGNFGGFMENMNYFREQTVMERETYMADI